MHENILDILKMEREERLEFGYRVAENLKEKLINILLRSCPKLVPAKSNNYSILLEDFFPKRNNHFVR